MSLKQQLIMKKEVALGTFLGIPSPQITEMVGLAGYDFAILDTEHGTFSQESIENCLRAGASVGLPCILRVGELNARLIQSALDLGADGIQVPQVENVDEAKAAVAFAHFPPDGVRGYGSTTRAAGFGFKGRSVVRQKVSNDIIISIQIESKTGVENLDSILQVSGIDVVFIGTSDLSLSYGLDSPDHPTMLTIVDEIIPKIKKAGKVVGVFLSDWNQLSHFKNLGITYFTVSGAGLIKAAFQEQVVSFKKNSVQIV